VPVGREDARVEAQPAHLRLEERRRARDVLPVRGRRADRRDAQELDQLGEVAIAVLSDPARGIHGALLLPRRRGAGGRRLEPEARRVLGRVDVLEGAPLGVHLAPLLLLDHARGDRGGEVAHRGLALAQEALEHREAPARPEGVQGLEVAAEPHQHRVGAGAALRQERDVARGETGHVAAGGEDPLGLRGGQRRVESARRAPVRDAIRDHWRPEIHVGGGVVRHHQRRAEQVAEQGDRPRGERHATGPEEALRHPAHARGAAARDDRAGAARDGRGVHGSSSVTGAGPSPRVRLFAHEPDIRVETHLP